MKIWKWLAGVLIGLLALGALGVVTLTLLIDPNRFRGQIEAAVQQVTGRPFTIRGDLDIAWFPWLAIRTGAAELGNPPGMTGPALVQWQSARVGVRLVPWVRGQLVIDRVRFDGLQVFLERTNDGRTNWDDLFSKQEGKDAQKRTLPQIAGIEIRDGALDFQDGKAGSHFRIRDWNLDVGTWKTGETVPVSTQLWFEKVTTETQAPLRVQLDFETQARLSEQMDHAELRKTELSGRVRGGAFPAPGVAFETELPQFSATLSPLKIAATDWHLQLAGAQIAGSLTAEKKGAQLHAEGPLSIKMPSARDFLAALGIDAPLPRDAEAMRRLTLTTSWSFVDGAIAVKPIALQLDETSFQGEIARSSGEQPTWTFALRGDHIDLARYLLTEDKDQEPFELPVDTLRDLRAQGTLAFDQATFADARMKNARLQLLMADGQLRATSAHAGKGAARE